MALLIKRSKQRHHTFCPAQFQAAKAIFQMLLQILAETERTVDRIAYAS